MGDTTAISWAHHTFNPWEGCTRISPACDHCYAADRAHRFGNDHLWSGQLRRTSLANWRRPHRWNREAQAAGERRRVFCASLADVFDNQAPQEWREDLWELIEETPHLQWMLLTKRPQNVLRRLPLRWLAKQDGAPRNVEIGTTAEDQLRADQRIGHVLEIARILRWLPFVSAEPLLGPLDLTRVALPGTQPGIVNALTGVVAEAALHESRGAIFMGPLDFPRINLVIAGGESGPKARPSHPGWFRRLRDDCAATGVCFHFKQWGEWAPLPSSIAGAGLDRMFWGAEIPGSRPIDDVYRLGKGRAGHCLDGIDHLSIPVLD